LDISWAVNGKIAILQEFRAFSGEDNGKKKMPPH
jgi:hypothetical protein